MTNQYIQDFDRQTLEGNVVYEIHFSWMGIDRGVGSKEGGYSIRYVESENSKQGRESAIEAALDDIFTYFSQEALSKMVRPPNTSHVVKHPSWEWLHEHKKLRLPKGGRTKNVSSNKVMRGEQRSSGMENALDYLEEIGLA